MEQKGTYVVLYISYTENSLNFFIEAKRTHPTKQTLQKVTKHKIPEILI